MTIDDTAIDIAIDDITLGDGGGHPSGKPAGAQAKPDYTKPGQPKPTAKATRQPTLAEVEALRRERDQRIREAQEAQARAAEAQARAEAEARARGEMETHVLKTRGHALTERLARVTGELDQINAAIASTQALATSAQRELEAAMADEQASPQDKAARVAKAQRDLSRAEAELVQLEAGKGGAERAVAEAKWYLAEEERAAQVYAQTRTQASQQADATPAGGAGAQSGARQPAQRQTPEQWIDGIRSRPELGGDKVADWLADHKEFVTDPKLNAKVIAYAQHYAVVEEKPLNSEEFVAALNARFFPETDEDDEGAAAGDGGGTDAVVEEVPATQTRRAPSASASHAAPVSRNAGYFSSRNPNGSKIRLSPFLANLAREMGMTPEEYALNARKQIQEGRLPKNFLDPDYHHDVGM